MAETSEFDPQTMRRTKPGHKRLILTFSVVFSYILASPFLYKSIEVYRAPLPFQEMDSLSAQIESNRIQFPCRFQAIFIGFDWKSSVSSLEASIISHMSKLTSQTLHETPHFGPCCGSNRTVSVILDSKGSTIVDFDSGDEEVDEAMLSVLGDFWGSGGEVYSVVVVNREVEVRAAVGKYRHAWIVGRASEEEAVARAAEMFVKVFGNGGKEEGLIQREFMPVGDDGNVVLSFNLLNAEPRDWIYDWDFETVDKTLLAPIVEAMKPIADISVESQVLYRTPKSSLSYWDDKLGSYIVKTKDLPFFVNSNEWHLDTSIAVGGRSKVLHFSVYVPSVNESPLRLQLPDGQISKTNGFISPMWGGVIVWNPRTCRKGSDIKRPARCTISQEDLLEIFEVFMGQLRQLFGFKSDGLYVGNSGTSSLLASDKGFTVWELDYLSRIHTCFNLHSCAETLKSLSRLVQSLPRMVIIDEIGKQVKYSLEAAKLALTNTSAGIYADSAVSSRQARSLADDAFFHPSIMSHKYRSFEHYLNVYVGFISQLTIILLLAKREWRIYVHEDKKYLAWKSRLSKAY